MSTTPNMNIALPTVGTTVGPTWATNINSAFSTVDSHDHSSGKGVQVTPSGININSDFPMVSNNITQIRSGRFTAQGSPLALSTDLNCVYVSGVDLYYNDGNGNQVRITQSGNVAGSAGSISGLSSPASASYAAGVFTWQSAANTPATMDSGSVIIRELVANGKGVTLQTVAALASDYSIYLPQLPASTKMMIMDSSGNITASYVTDNSTIEVSSNTIRVKDSGITNAKIADDSVTKSKLNEDVSTIFHTQAFTSSGTWTVPAGVYYIWINMCGGGGGGLASSPGNYSEGGHGAPMVVAPLAVTPAGTVTVTIGAGGAAATQGSTTSVSMGGGGALNAIGGLPGRIPNVAYDITKGAPGPFGDGATASSNAASNSGAGGGGGSTGGGVGGTGGSGIVYINWLEP